MVATMATRATLNPKCLTINSHKNTAPTKPPTRPISLVSSKSSSLIRTPIAGAVFSTLSFSESAMAAQRITDIAEGDNRGQALLLPVTPSIAWVLYNILPIEVAT